MSYIYNKLKSMTDFVLEQEKAIPNELNLSPMSDCDRLFVKRVIGYGRFLKQSLKLEMFVTCADNGDIWEYPPTQEEWDWATRDSMEAEQSFKQKEFYYQKAKEKVLFEDFKFLNKKCVGNEDIDIYFDLDSINIYNGNSHFKAHTIEDLIKENLTLTENATKKFL